MSLFDSHTILAKVSSDSNQRTGGALMSEKIGKLRLEVAGVIIFVVIVLAIMIAIQGDRISDMNKQVKNLQSQVETLQMAMDQDPTQVEESAQLEQTEPVIMMSTMPMSGAGGPKL